MDKHVAPLRTHYPDTEPTWPLLLNLKCCALKGELVNTYFIVFDLTQLFYDYSNTSLLSDLTQLFYDYSNTSLLSDLTQLFYDYSNTSLLSLI
jgi:hypothetical protein